jgi:lysophospholipase L1-like esterase
MEILPVNRNILRTAFAVAVMAVMLAPNRLTAQEPANKPETMAPAAAQTTPAAAPAAAAQRATTREDQLKNDWPWLGRFKEANLALGAPAAGETRVVFMGDSITQGWHLDESFPGKPYVNRGISGQTSPQMVLRFRQDVIDLKPKAVVILAGTNDIAGNTGPMTLEESEGNVKTMAELATANHIRVVLCSVLPAFDFSWTPGKTPALKIDALNAWIKAYAAEKGYIYVDYHSAMQDERDGLPKRLSEDGVHPNAAGYAIMAPLAQAGIEKALKQ